MSVPTALFMRLVRWKIRCFCGQRESLLVIERDDRRSDDCEKSRCIMVFDEFVG